MPLEENFKNFLNDDSIRQTLKKLYDAAREGDKLSSSSLEVKKIIDTVAVA